RKHHGEDGRAQGCGMQPRTGSRGRHGRDCEEGACSGGYRDGQGRPDVQGAGGQEETHEEQSLEDKLALQGAQKAVRTSTKVYNVGKMKAMYMNSFVRLPGVREALSVRRNAVLRHEAAPHKPECVSKPEKIKFPDTGPTDKCKCTYDCFRDDCLNADTSYYCTAANCNREGNCLNSLYECKDLELTVCKGTGIGVKATATIHAGSIIGNYTGVLTTHNLATDEEQTCDYALELQLKGTRGQKVYIDASYNANAEPLVRRTLRNRENVAVVVVAKRTIEVGEETVDYVDPWFDCVCAAYCRG
ncbi:hypothetical protein GN958_ATG02834, partial [Phytophthora infestans]